MKISVFGLWHLGSVTAACLARKGFEVTGVDLDLKTVQDLSQGKAPLFEPGLDDLIAQGISAGKLRFSADLKAVAQDSDLIWVAFDTPVDENDQADLPFLKKRMAQLFAVLKPNTPIVFSSQVPVGFGRSLAASFKRARPKEKLVYCASPENLRLGSAIASFDQAARIIAGTFSPEDRAAFELLFSAVCPHIEWMSVESAEMVKHAINSFLATSIAFTNELAVLCEKIGADARDVERGLKTEPRIGPKAYVKAGSAFAGGTLARDLHFLVGLAGESKQPAYVLKAVLKSNDFHKAWARHQIERRSGSLKNRRVSFLGLSYKAGTSATRRSWAIELCQWLTRQGAVVTAYDSAIKTLTGPAMARIKLVPSADQALRQADIVVVGTDDPAFKLLEPRLFKALKKALVLDANGVLKDALKGEDMPVTYVTVGRP